MGLTGSPFPHRGGTREVRITGAAPKVEISTTKRKITAHAGAVLVRATAEAIGLGPAIDAHLRLKVRDRGLSEAESILGMAEALAAGAKCLDDLEVARADRVQEELRGFGVPPPQTAGRFLRRFCLGHIGQLNKALRQVLLRALSLVGVGEAVTLDFDSTYIRSRSSRRQGADPTYLKRYALHPLVCFVAESGICLHAKLRRGRANTAKGLLPFVDECLRGIPGRVAVRAPALESEHRHKALVESGVRELKENFGLEVLRKHQFMANWAWLLIVVTAHNLVRLTQLLGGVEPKADLRGKRFRYRYLAVPGLLVASGRRLVLKLRSDYPLYDRFTGAFDRLCSIAAGGP